MDALWILLGLVLLLGGGELVVRGAAKLAIAAGMTPIAVALTVVAFATSAPELAASMTAATSGAPAVAVGNVVGSNIANIGLILGIAGLLRPIPVTATFLKREMGVLVVAALALVAVLADGAVARWEGLLLVGALLAYVGYMLRVESKAASAEVEREYEQEYAPPRRDAAVNLAILAVGIGLLVGGAQALVHGAVSLARTMGVPEEVIGLTIVAVGTSLPELASSLVAAWRNHGDIVLGNVVGSNIFNVLGILGLTALVRPLDVSGASFGTDLGVMIGFSIVLAPILFAGMRLRRWEGALLLGGYGVYLATLFAA